MDRPKRPSAARRSSKSQGAPSCFMRAAASMEWTRITSCSACLSPPFFTAAIRMFSVARKGSCSIRFFSITAGYTVSPSVTFSMRSRIPSTARKPSGREMRRLALSSSVRSSHWAAAVMGAFSAFAMT